jgi:hypothetical protein
MNLIILIDDKSNYDYITPLNFPVSNIIYIQSEYPGSGELLPYFYLYKYKFFERALIIHDSLFLQSPPSLEEILKIETVKFLWIIPGWYDREDDIFAVLGNLPNVSGLVKFFHSQKWYRCFGVQSIIHISFLEQMEEHFELFLLLNQLKTRENRMSLERIFGMLCSILDPTLFQNKNPSLYGNICLDYMKWGYTFNQYLCDKKTNQIPNYPMIKIWTSR